jgi:hypothetical protein
MKVGWARWKTAGMEACSGSARETMTNHSWKTNNREKGDNGGKEWVDNQSSE